MVVSREAAAEAAAPAAEAAAPAAAAASVSISFYFWLNFVFSLLLKPHFFDHADLSEAVSETKIDAETDF